MTISGAPVNQDLSYNPNVNAAIFSFTTNIGENQPNPQIAKTTVSERQAQDGGKREKIQDVVTGVWEGIAEGRITRSASDSADEPSPPAQKPFSLLSHNYSGLLYGHSNVPSVAELSTRTHEDLYDMKFSQSSRQEESRREAVLPPYPQINFSPSLPSGSYHSTRFRDGADVVEYSSRSSLPPLPPSFADDVKRT